MKAASAKTNMIPLYSKGEEIFNMTSHIVGAAFGFVALLYCVILSVMHGDVWAIVSSIIYGCSLIILYTMSSIYHGLPVGLPKQVMRVMDHCTIYFLIVGTYAPVTLAGLRPTHPVLAWVVFGIILLLAVVATVFTAIDLKKFLWFSVACYIGMGWCIILTVKTFIEVLGLPCFLLVLIGGICYTFGSVLYCIGKKKHSFWHSVFHIFVLAGSVLHFIAIIQYII